MSPDSGRGLACAGIITVASRQGKLPLRLTPRRTRLARETGNPGAGPGFHSRWRVRFSAACVAGRNRHRSGRAPATQRLQAQARRMGDQVLPVSQIRIIDENHEAFGPRATAIQLVDPALRQCRNAPARQTESTGCDIHVGVVPYANSHNATWKAAAVVLSTTDVASGPRVPRSVPGCTKRRQQTGRCMGSRGCQVNIRLEAESQGSASHVEVAVGADGAHNPARILPCLRPARAAAFGAANSPTCWQRGHWGTEGTGDGVKTFPLVSPTFTVSPTVSGRASCRGRKNPDHRRCSRHPLAHVHRSAPRQSSCQSSCRGLPAP